MNYLRKAIETELFRCFPNKSWQQMVNIGTNKKGELIPQKGTNWHEYDDFIDAILSAFEAALPKPKQLKYITDGGTTLTKEGKQRFFRYGGYDFAISEVKHIIHQAKEKIMKTPTQQDDELDTILKKYGDSNARLESGEYNGSSDDLYLHDSAKKDLAALIHDREAKAERRGRIAELENISNSRRIEDSEHTLIGPVWCENCHMILEESTDDCACIILTTNRLKQLAAQSEQEGSDHE